jgi:V/A-type H+-transporting ATPase subunit I
MAIVQLKKVTLIGSLTYRDRVLEELQAAGCAHVISKQETSRSTLKQQGSPNQNQSEKSERAISALKYLMATRRQRLRQNPNNDQPLSEIIEAIIENRHRRADKVDEIEVIRQHLRALKHWGSFTLPPLETIGHYRFWFYEVPLSKTDKLHAIPYAWKIVSRDHFVNYTVVIAKQEPSAESVPFPRAHTGSQSLLQARVQLQQAQIQLEELDAQRESLTRWIQPIVDSLDATRDNEQRQWVFDQLNCAADCFILQAWVRVNDLPTIEALAAEFRCAVTICDPKANEDPPVALQNPKATSGAEQVVNFFQLPSYRSWDPSVAIFFSFPLFFAMILADAGYALLLALPLVWRWRRWSRSPLGAGLVKFAATATGVAFMYGVFAGSYFGVTPTQLPMLAKLQFINLQDFDFMLLLSLFIGIAHILLANAVRAATHSMIWKKLAPWGWNIVIVGALLLWLGNNKLPSLGSMPGILALVVGTLIIITCSGERSINNAKDLLWRLLDGFKSLYGISRAFGDVMSYLRLFALGLASATLAVTFNQLAIDARDSVEHGGWVLFLLVILAGHGLNLILSLMGGVIHGLRLNLLEFYNWGLEGEGEAFKPFYKREKH